MGRDEHVSDESDLEEFEAQQAMQGAPPGAGSSSPGPAAEPMYGRRDMNATLVARGGLDSHDAHSARSVKTASTKPPANSRFKATVKRVIHMHRGHSTFMAGVRGIGSEPGVDPRRGSASMEFGHLRENCAIEVIDYSSLRSSHRTLKNSEFVSLLEEPDAGRASWTRIRWINIGGLSWDVIKAVALKHKLHPLALEDVLSLRGASTKRTKADYFKKQLFIRIQTHTLSKDADGANTALSGIQAPTAITSRQRSDSPAPYERKDGIEKTSEGFARDPGDPEIARPKRKPTSSSQSRLIDIARQERVQAITVEELKKAERVHVKVSPMFIFLLRDGTVVSLVSAPTLEFTQPISTRLRSSDSVLRSSVDPSLLIQSLLDLVVDRSMEVVQAYHAKILKFEHDILVKPKVNTVKYLHILSGDLILHTRTLEPIKTMIFGLRRYDLDRCAALIDSDGPHSEEKAVGYFSHKSKIYLADVYDHMDYILTSLEMYEHIADNLIDYTFNLASYQMNQVMWRLTAVTIICLPLTLLTGYFGMNFEVFWAIRRSDAFFWYLAVPMLVLIIPMLTHAEIKRGYLVLKDKMLTKKLNKDLKDE